MITRTVKILILVHMCMSLGGVLVHMNLHPIEKSLYYWLVPPVSAFSLLVLPFLFARPSTAAWGFMLNAFAVGIGTIGMGYFSLHTFEAPVTFARLIADSTLPAILILWTKVMIAYRILYEWRKQVHVRPERGCRE